jgi:hypothetical protein
MNKEDYWKLKWALELAKPKDNCINYNQYAKDVLRLMEEENNQLIKGSDASFPMPETICPLGETSPDFTVKEEGHWEETEYEDGCHTHKDTVWVKDNQSQETKSPEGKEQVSMLLSDAHSVEENKIPDTQSLERTDIKRSEPPLVRGENPCVKVKQELKHEINKDWEQSNNE